jgi:hypothetical protein
LRAVEARATEAAAAKAAEEEAARRRALEAAAAEETQVITVQQPRPRAGDTAVDDRPHLIPGFDRGDEAETTAEVTDPDATAVVTSSTRPESDQTIALPRSIDDTAVDQTQVIPGDVPDDPKPPSRRPPTRRRR